MSTLNSQTASTSCSSPQSTSARRCMEPVVSSYEADRLQRIRNNKARIAALDILALSESVKPQKSQVVRNKAKSLPTVLPLTCTTRSMTEGERSVIDWIVQHVPPFKITHPEAAKETALWLIHHGILSSQHLERMTVPAWQNIWQLLHI